MATRGPLRRALGLLLLPLLIFPLPLPHEHPAIQRMKLLNATPVETCILGSQANQPSAARIAVVKPTFTLTPYANFGNSFYAFYYKYKNSTTRITTDLDWLRTAVTNEWSDPKINNEKPLFDFMTSAIASRCGILEGQNMKVIDDVLVDNGALFSGTVRQYDVAVLGHEEYCTRHEYDQFKQFVATGGRVVAMSGNTFWAQVNYSKSSGVETFVVGHGFQFNGKYAWRTSAAPFDVESTSWFGSVFSHDSPKMSGAIINNQTRLGNDLVQAFGTSFAFMGYSYKHNEVNYVSNFTNTHVLARFYTDYFLNGEYYYAFPFRPVDAYSHQYVKGEVICFGVFGENLILNDEEAQYFLVDSVIHGFGTQAGLFRPPHPL
jgi:hypothetical protein